MSFKKRLKKRIEREIELPQSLNEEAVMRMLGVNGSQGKLSADVVLAEPNKGRFAVLRYAAAALAAIVIVAALGTLGYRAFRQIEKSRLDSILSDAIENGDALGEEYAQIKKAAFARLGELYADSADSFNLFNRFASDKNESVAEGADMGTGSTDTASGISKTNNQVEGVEEADIIKTTSQHIYYANAEQDAVYIVSCADAENMSVAAKIELEDSVTVNELLLYKDELVVIGSVYSSYAAQDYEVWHYGGVVAYIYDVSDASAPKKKDTLMLDGSYISSRLVGGRLVISASYFIRYGSCIAGTFSKSCRELEKILVPRYSLGGGESKYIPEENITLLDGAQPDSYTVVCVYSLDGGSAQISAVMGGGENMYMSEDGLYIAQSVYGEYNSGEDTSLSIYNSDNRGDTASSFTRVLVFTRVNYFSLGDGAAKLCGSADVAGTIINQFAMHENGDYFSVATTSTDNNGKTSSNVFVLNAKMETVGYLTGIAPGETITAARFLGDTLYLVTFEQTDPLFVIDISDPTSPQTLGELKIPGFSSYLHPVGENLLVGIGTGGDENGADSSAKISLFDISDPASPKEVDSLIFADSYLNTEHKAFVSHGDSEFFVPIVTSSYTPSYSEYTAVLHIGVNARRLELLSETVCSGLAQTRLRPAFIGNVMFAVCDSFVKAYSLSDYALLGELSFS